jgi:hypothetical protein
MQLKQHFIAFTILGLYFLCWIWLGYTALHEFNNNGDGEVVGTFLYSFLPCVFFPYFLITGIIAVISKQQKAFYWKLVWLILLPIPIAALVALAIHFLYHSN